MRIASGVSLFSAGSTGAGSRASLLNYFRHVAEQKQARRYVVTGRVQGVGYRYFAQKTADDLGLAGYVRNLSDGRVEAYAIGTPAQMEEFKIALLRGPALSRVTHVAEEPCAPDSAYGGEFRIESTY